MAENPNPFDVVIIGGGVVGCTLARTLARYRLRIGVLEACAEVGFGVSKANSGIVHAGQHTSPTTLKGVLEWPGNEGWARLHEELGFGFTRCGEFVVAFTDEELGTLEKLRKQGEGKGVPGLEIWERDRVLEAEPNVSTEILAALHAPTAGVINPYEAVFTLAENARANGVEFIVDSPVTGIAAAEEVLAVRTPTGTYHGRYVVNAAGLHADEVARLAGVGTFTITPRKGEEYLLDKRLQGIVSRIIFPCPTPTTKGILVIPTYDGTIMVGPTAEVVEDKHDTATTAAGAEQVFASVQRLVPGISQRDAIASFAGLRPVSDAEDFIIGPTTLPRFINAAGIQSPGLTAAPAIADHLVDILAEEGLPLGERDDWEPRLRWPTRFATRPPEVQQQLAAADPRFAHLVCRCEHVTEAEIVDAIDRGAATLDGLKFRTRAGMGRCQGGFCTWRCMQLLADRLGVPPTAVTKRGGDSWVVCARDELAAAAEPQGAKP